MSGAFWELVTKEEFEVVGRFLKRRFPDLHSQLTRALEAIDPYDLVYPGNPGEYDWLIWEYVVLLSPFDYQIATVSDSQLRAVFQQGASVRFPEALSESALDDLITAMRAS